MQPATTDREDGHVSTTDNSLRLNGHRVNAVVIDPDLDPFSIPSDKPFGVSTANSVFCEQQSLIRDFPTIITCSHQLRDAAYKICQGASSPRARFFLKGETGVGKELFAQAIHKIIRPGREFFSLNCGAVPSELIESELFGHEKGAFTNAHQMKRGMFELADNGTLFLDEIGDLPLLLQVKLLRVLESGTSYRVGGSREITSHALIIAATNRDLSSMVDSGHFRRDLYFRLNNMPITIPPLSSRLEDIPLLLHYFLRKYCQGRRIIIPGTVVQSLVGYSWPGNVRELNAAVDRGVTSGSAYLKWKDFFWENEGEPQLRRNGLGTPQTLREARDDFEKGYLVMILTTFKGNVSRAAEAAGKDRAEFYRLLRKHAIIPSNFKPKESHT